LSQISTFFYWFGSLSIFTRSSSILYEADEVSIFGIAKYNKFIDAWEISKPIAIMKESVGKVISYLSSQ
jgi:hypothetical protein